MRTRRYEVLLPTTHNDGRPLDRLLFDQTREELVAKFRGQGKLFTVLRHEGQMRRLIVDVDEVSDHHEFFTHFKATLLDRFEQIEIYIASYPIDIL